MTRFAIAITAALLAATPAWAINKCVGPDGKTVFQDMPCAGGQGGAIDVKPASGSASPDAASQAQTQLDKARRTNAIAHAIAIRQPVNGMTADELQKAMGAPSKVNRNNYNGTQKDQWIFYRPNGTWYIYTTDAIVEGIQFREGATDPSANAAPQNCPTDMELRNLEVSARKLGASNIDREKYRDALADARACAR